MIARESSVLPADHDRLTMPERYIRCGMAGQGERGGHAANAVEIDKEQAGQLVHWILSFVP